MVAENPSAKEVAYKHVKTQILRRAWEETQFLTEGSVAESLGISRTPVREAFHRLEAEGLLRLVKKRGAFIPPISDRDVGETMEARELIETYSAGRAGIDAKRLSEGLADLLRKQEGLSSDAAAFIECDRQFHRQIVESSGNALLVNLYESLRDRQLRMGIQAVAGDQSRLRQVIVEHEAIVTALQREDVRAAKLAIRKHLSQTLAALRQGS